MRPIPPHIDELLAQPNPAVIGTLRPDGSPHTAPTFYGWEGGRVFVTMDAIRLRVAWLQRDPRVSLTVIDLNSWYRHVTLMGRVVSLDPDGGLADYDRLCARYGRSQPVRNRVRVTAWIEVDRWYSWDSANSSPDSLIAPVEGA